MATLFEIAGISGRDNNVQLAVDRAKFCAKVDKIVNLRSKRVRKQKLMQEFVSLVNSGNFYPQYKYDYLMAAREKI